MIRSYGTAVGSGGEGTVVLNSTALAESLTFLRWGKALAREKGTLVGGGGYMGKLTLEGKGNE